MGAPIDWRVVLVLLAMLLAGVGLIWLGVRGRRVGDHPTCRRCGFDLVGAPRDSVRCPECGADVEYGRNVAIGRRRRDAWPFVVAAMLLALAALGTVGVASRVDWRAALPTWYVLREARTGNAAGRVVPIHQLLARDALASLPAEDRVTLGRAILALQRDPANVWSPAWGDWLARRAIDRTLPPADADAFWQNLLADGGVTLRTTIRRGGTPAMRIVTGGRRGRLSSNNATVRGRISTRDRTLTVDGVVDPTAERGYMSASVDFGPGESWLGSADASPAWRALAAGPHAVEWSCPVRIYAGTPPDDDGGGVPELARVVVRWRGTITVFDGDDDVRLLPDPALADAIRGAITVTKLRLPPLEKGYSPMLELTLGMMPADVAFDIFAKQGDGPEQKLTTFQRAKSSAPGNHAFGLSDVRLEPGKADLIFRASADAARATVDLFEIWGGEVRIENVPVERDTR